MSVGYDPLLGELRSSNSALITPPMIDYPGQPILHLPLHDDARDASPYQREIIDNELLFTPDGWASGSLAFPLEDVDLSDMTLAANIQISDSGNMFGIDSDINAFFWQNRGGSYTVLETWDCSYDHDIDPAGSGESFHLAATLSGNIITIYVNGKFYDQTEWSSLAFPGATFYIWPSFGLISDVRLYKNCLSEAEIWDVYQTDKR